jgi:sugar lactone lactonase YvrE
MKQHLLLSILALAAPAMAQNAYLICSDTDRLFTVNLTTGAATLIGSTAGILGTPAGLAWRPDTLTLWTIDLAGGEVGTLDTNTGAFTQVFTAVPANGWQGIDFDATTGFFYLLNQDFNMYKLDPATGVTTLLGPSGAPLATALETDIGGNLYAMGFSNGILYQVNKTTGAFTPTVTTSPLNMQGMAFDLTGALFAVNTTTDSLYRIDPMTGTTTLIGPHGNGILFAKGFEIESFLSGTPARVVPSGVGCVNGAVSFYELFNPGTFDLANTGLQMIPAGTGYVVLSMANSFVNPTTTGLGLTDDSLSGVLALPFSFPYPGGSTNQLRVCSNGFIYLNGTGASASFTPAVPDALTGGPRLFPMWMDLLPDGPTNVNNVFFEVDNVLNRALITWLNVPEFGSPSNLSTLQVVLNASGIVEYTWRTAANVGAGHSCLVGFSPGAANRDPGSRDISATMPFTTTADRSPLGQNSQRPVIGTTFNLQVSNIPAGSLAGIEIIGPPLPGGGLDLTPAGMPGCFLYVSPILIALPFSTAGSSANIPLALPNDPSLVGGQVPVQAISVSPGVNSMGVATSNLVTLFMGNV